MARKKRTQGRVTPKGTRPRNWSGGGPTQLPNVQDAPVLVAQVGRSLREPDPFGFLTFVSSLAGSSDARLRDPFSGGGDDGPADLLGLMDMFADSDSVETHALLIGLSHLACSAEERARAAGHLVLLSEAKRAKVPRWLLLLGDAIATKATSQHDHGGDFSYEILEVVVDGHAMVMMMNVDHNAGRSMFDGYPAPVGLEEVVRLASRSEELPIIYSDADVHESAARIQHAIDRDARTIPQCETETWPGSRALFEWAVRMAGPAEACDFDYEETPESLQDELEARFMASTFGRAAAKAGATAHLDILWWYSAGYGHARPLVWGPQRAWIALTDWFPRKVMISAEEAQLFPMLLCAWIQFAHAETGVPASYTEYVFEAVADAEPVFLEQMAGGDERSETFEMLGAALGDDGDGVFEFGFDDDDADYEAVLAELAEQSTEAIKRAVGEANYEAISGDPLPIEDFEYEDIDQDIHDTLGEWVAEIQRGCGALFDGETQTAAFRLLRRIALANPATFRKRSSANRGALALLWAIGRANEMIATYERRPGVRRQLMNEDLTDFFDAPRSGHATRATDLLRTAGIDRHVGGLGLFLGDPELLTGEHRQRLIERRDRQRYT